MAFYFDLTDKERFSIPAENLGQWARAERMNRGIEEPVMPLLENEPESLTKPPTAPIYTVKVNHRQYVEHSWDTAFTVAFETMEKAKDFMAPMPLTVLDGKDGSMIRVPVSNCQMGIEQTNSLEEYQKFGSSSKARADVRERNKQAMEAYDKALKASESVDEEIGEDWNRVQRLNYRYETVIKTFREYVGMTQDGNEITALLFLAKTYSPELIRDTWQWFGMDINLLQTSLPGFTLPAPSDSE